MAIIAAFSRLTETTLSVNRGSTLYQVALLTMLYKGENKFITQPIAIGRSI